MRFSHNFYLDLLSFLKYKFPTFYWGEDETGYYWGDDSRDIDLIRCNSLQEIVESVSNFLYFCDFYE